MVPRCSLTAEWLKKLWSLYTGYYSAMKRNAFELVLMRWMESESCSVLCDSLQARGYTVHGILQARILEWVAFPFSRESS